MAYEDVIVTKYVETAALHQSQQTVFTFSSLE